MGENAAIQPITLNNSIGPGAGLYYRADTEQTKQMLTYATLGPPGWPINISRYIVSVRSVPEGFPLRHRFIHFAATPPY